MRRGGSRPIELGRATWGLALLLAPRAVMHGVHHVQVDSRSLAVARVLGARQLAQAALSGIRPTPEVLAVGVWVDTVHAITAAGLAMTDRSRSRAALTDMAVAGAWAVLGYRDLTAGRTVPDTHEQGRDRLARRVLSAVPLGGLLLGRVEEARAASRPGVLAGGPGGPGDPGASPQDASDAGATGAKGESRAGVTGSTAPPESSTRGTPVLSTEQVKALQGGTVIDSDGTEIGTISRIFRDAATGRARWVTVGTGLFGNPEMFIPLWDAQVSGQQVAVSFTADTARDAPRMVVDREMDDEQVRLLHRYYDGAHHGS